MCAVPILASSSSARKHAMSKVIVLVASKLGNEARCSSGIKSVTLSKRSRGLAGVGRIS